MEPETALRPVETTETVHLGDEISSGYAVLIDLQTNTILAEKEAQAVINPASMTKVLTLLVAVEQLEEADLEDTFTMTIDITDYCYVNDCSVVGLDVGETVIRPRTAIWHDSLLRCRRRPRTCGIYCRVS
ncbi:MAG: hypothetical protein V8R75_08660 [Oscillospiraceae bacterium]